ncbi:hypothetical protein [Cohnella caldifontis]|uniref:hypothetical protein n=1 Tax=Cohnella caldifontis TaxID=3027471 RepID=UPI0023ECFFC8|nr:hypothetical protein [Cohnella sp. YIM B05605]
MSDQKFAQMEHLLTELIHAVGTLKAYFEEEREENQRRFERFETRFEQIELRLDRIETRMDRLEERMDRLEERMDRLEEQNEDSKETQSLMMSKIFEHEMEIRKFKDRFKHFALKETRQDR